MREKLIKCLHKIGLYNEARWLFTRTQSLLWRIYSLAVGHNKKILKQYMLDNNTYKIQLGCGLNNLDGWLNTDIAPGKDRFRVDISKRFPLPENMFDYAFSEHVIEHLPYKVGGNMLSECFKTLKPNGVLRISTPDMKFLINLYEKDNVDLNKRYIDWNADNFIKGKAPHDAISVFNNYVRDWGHQYIYDYKSLSTLLSSAGFTDIKIVKIKESEHSHLQNLENTSRHPEGFLELESMILEATKPSLV